jgi:rod shape-determining protein MreD
MKFLYAVLVFAAGLAAQWAWGTYLPLLGVAPQVLLVLTVAVAARAGPVAGQCYAFTWGLFLDAFGAHLFGANALALTLVGYAVGRGRRQMDVSSPLSQVMVVSVVSVAYLVFYAAVGLVFGGEALWAPWKALLLAPLLNALLAPFGFAFVEHYIRL